MRVLRVAFMWTLRRLRIELQRRIIQLFESNLAGIEASHGVLAHRAEESRPIFLTRARFVFETQRLEQGGLLLRSQLYKSLARRLLSVRVQPGQPSAEAILRLGIARH